MSSFWKMGDFFICMSAPGEIAVFLPERERVLLEQMHAPGADMHMKKSVFLKTFTNYGIFRYRLPWRL